MLSIQLHHKDSNSLDVLNVTMYYVIYGFGIMYIACELGQQMSIAFDECTDLIGQFEWYAFPIEIQRMLPMILNFAMQPVEIKCFGTITSDRETFKYVRPAHNHFNHIIMQFIDSEFHFPDSQDVILIFHCFV